ncbi:hypothetical protein [Vulgatibacter incomptus]|uniref:Lipoprotein n=1 Tax=Vulgatibacter incomptus TaxID=1391653 RepID=A0A0K1PA56_9BACT|nr:hypothetical protein [Vulgatibacter incomptus]AKU90400.1 hypothetical protein AKJ08_0787 [Vulgatibacter incomptus]
MRLIPAALALALFSGCLVAQPYEEERPEDPFANDPPRILSRRPSTSVIRTQGGCQPLRLEIPTIRDLDPDDQLEVRWFINYEEPGNQKPDRTKIIPAGFRLQEGIRSPAGDEYALKLNLYRGKVVVVEAVVSDGFDPDTEEAPAWRAVRKGKDFDQASWTIYVEDVAECLQ